MKMAVSIVPQWYIDAKTAGASEASLREQVHNFCLAGAQKRAQRLGEPIPSEVEADFVDLTHALYNASLQEENEA